MFRCSLPTIQRFPPFHSSLRIPEPKDPLAKSSDFQRKEPQFSMRSLLRLVFDPFVSGTIYYVLSRDSAPALQGLVSEQTKQSLLKYAKYVFILGVAARINRYLSRWAENRWKAGDDKGNWKWPNEIVVVTGGSNGIGALVSKMLSNRGVKVAVLDVQPLSEELKDCKLPPLLASTVVHAVEAHGAPDGCLRSLY